MWPTSWRSQISPRSQIIWKQGRTTTSMLPSVERAERCRKSPPRRQTRFSGCTTRKLTGCGVSGKRRIPDKIQAFRAQPPCLTLGQKKKIKSVRLLRWDTITNNYPAQIYHGLCRCGSLLETENPALDEGVGFSFFSCSVSCHRSGCCSPTKKARLFLCKDYTKSGVLSARLVPVEENHRPSAFCVADTSWREKVQADWRA